MDQSSRDSAVSSRDAGVGANTKRNWDEVPWETSEWTNPGASCTAAGPHLRFLKLNQSIRARTQNALDCAEMLSAAGKSRFARRSAKSRRT
ncbi:hypothetical protein E4U54_001630 [Claviceps lovelessii]|nr:hypothetical protein E4U54_001630 [Claviceps lovelessii]